MEPPEINRGDDVLFLLVYLPFCKHPLGYVFHYKDYASLKRANV